MDSNHQVSRVTPTLLFPASGSSDFTNSSTRWNWICRYGFLPYLKALVRLSFTTGTLRRPSVHSHYTMAKLVDREGIEPSRCRRYSVPYLLRIELNSSPFTTQILKFIQASHLIGHTCVFTFCLETFNQQRSFIRGRFVLWNRWLFIQCPNTQPYAFHP